MPRPAQVIPVTYMNSRAALKAFVVVTEGIVCTSSNAADHDGRGRSSGAEPVLFFPDQHLGRNTAKAMGVPLAADADVEPRKPLGGNTEADLRMRR